VYFYLVQFTLLPQNICLALERDIIIAYRRRKKEKIDENTAGCFVVF
jgi:hypothetical protein